MFLNIFIPITPQECWINLQTRNCSGNQMLRDSALWKFEGNRQSEWRLRSITHDVLNCVYKEVSLKEIGEERQVWAVKGKIATAKQTGFAATNLTTFVWSPKESCTKPVEKCGRIKGRGTTLTKTNTPEGQTVLRIRDVANQVHFVLHGPMIAACDRSAFYLVANEPNLFVRYGKLPKDYQEPYTFLAEISLPATIIA